MADEGGTERRSSVDRLYDEVKSEEDLPGCRRRLLSVGLALNEFELKPGVDLPGCRRRLSSVGLVLKEFRVKPEVDLPGCRRRLLSVVRVLKEFASFLFSQFGLIAIVVSYSLIGAYIFGQLERPNEKSSCIRNRDLYNLAETSMMYRM